MILVAGGVCFANAQPQKVELRKVTFATGYIPNVQFIPFYVAAKKGYFAEEGLEVSFDYAMGAEPLKLVAQGKYEFGTADGDALFAAVATEVPLVSIFQLYQKNPIALYTLHSSKLDELAKLTGKTVGIPGLFGASFVGWQLAKSKNSELEKAKLQVIGYTQVQALQSKKVDAAIGYENNEPVVLAARGVKTHVFPLRDIAWMPGNGVVTSRQLSEKEPKVVAGFVKALSRGLSETLAKPEAAFDSVRQSYLPEIKSKAQVSEQLKVLEATLELWKPADGSKKLGDHNFEKLKEAEALLRKLKITSKDVQVEKHFTRQFL